MSAVTGGTPQGIRRLEGRGGGGGGGIRGPKGRGTGKGVTSERG